MQYEISVSSGQKVFDVRMYNCLSVWIDWSREWNSFRQLDPYTPLSKKKKKKDPTTTQKLGEVIRLIAILC